MNGRVSECRVNLGELLDKLSILPRDSVVYFQAKGTTVSKIIDSDFSPAEPPPQTGCPDCDDVSQFNPDLFLPHVIFKAADDAQVNKLMDAVSALVNSASDRRAAIRIKEEAGLYLSPDDLENISDPWE